jgi:hypothetical protein
MSEFTTFVLLEHTQSNVPVFRRVNGNQRVRMNTRLIDHPYLKLTFLDAADEKNKTIRLKLSSNSIYLKEQMDAGIPANEPFTAAEKKAVEFNNGFVMTKNPIVVQYLKASPQMEGFKGVCPDIIRPLYKVLDRTVEIKSENSLIKKQAKAIQRLLSLNLKEGQDLMIAINGKFFDPPKTLEEVQNGLVAWMNATDEAGLDTLLRKTDKKAAPSDESAEDEIAVLIARAVQNDIISFDHEKDQVSKKVNGKFVPVKTISSDMDKDARAKLFSDFLLTKEGYALADDIQEDLDKLEQK